MRTDYQIYFWENEEWCIAHADWAAFDKSSADKLVGDLIKASCHISGQAVIYRTFPCLGSDEDPPFSCKGVMICYGILHKFPDEEHWTPVPQDELCENPFKMNTIMHKWKQEFTDSEFKLHVYLECPQ